MKKIEVVVPWDRDTKGAHRFSETIEDITVGSLYIRKDKVEGDRPEKIKIVITEVK